MQPTKALLAVLLSVWLCGSSCQPDDALLLPERRQPVTPPPGAELLARFVHLTDSHLLDEESPARVPAARELTYTAWRAWESTSAQIFDGIIRAVNRIHASGRHIDFALFGGDACDNAQQNELRWFITTMKGGMIDPLSGPDDRSPDVRPEPHLDPHAPFDAQGLYQQGIHGNLPSIPWYVLLGNHDVFAMGVFPITRIIDGNLAAPLPLQPRPGLLLPSLLNPVAAWTHAKISPASPGPPNFFELPIPITPVADRAFFTSDDFVLAMQNTGMSPTGHGFTQDSSGWYSVSPLPGLRIIGLHTSDFITLTSGLPSHEGCISPAQLDWFRAELQAASARDEMIVVATHHPSRALEKLYGSAVGPEEFRRLLNDTPGVILHMAGHLHQNRVADRGNYIEIETCSTLDWPQEGRLIEIWRDADGSILIGYEMFSHLDDHLPPLGEDLLFELRLEAFNQATLDAHLVEARTVENFGAPEDRNGLIRAR